MIRQANLNDGPAIGILLTQLGYQASPAVIESMLDDSRQTTMVFESEDGLLGLIALIIFPYFPTGEQICRITALVAEKNKRGKGIGSTLIEVAKNHAKQHNCQLLEVTTSLSRYQAQEFYSKQGFEKRSLRYLCDL
ncbi:GNAT family N-acetyltransferase [Photobacterium rosenbergii]|uniref:GNAT family N-acetyltransferase n=1 Tax=Photobacterium rosenbergii TaxID=294936 RepID=A0ABU3ZIK3_9GAMM|nr:GNAT family N-acetyltransferase [Photobacterium rosenbergii]MDV5169965.1 GNAT family N-acetyltransferase [Photobacterium rosenbergii]